MYQKYIKLNVDRRYNVFLHERGQNLTAMKYKLVQYIQDLSNR